MLESARLLPPLHVVVVTSSAAEPDAPPPAEIGVLFALSVEADAFERQVLAHRESMAARFRFHTGTVAGRRVVWCVCGAGAEAATAATRQLIAGHRPTTVISAGFAGGLAPRLARGSVQRPTVAITEADGRGIDLKPAASTTMPLAIVSVEAVVATVSGKRALAARTGAALVDMETHAVAAAAAAAGLPCLGVRVVSDDASQSLPREVVGLAAARSPLRRLGAAVGAIGRRPSAVADFWRLWEHAVVDSRALAAAVIDAIGEQQR